MTDFEEHLDYPGDACVVAFASGDMRRYEWGATLRGYGAPHVLLRDSTERWYLEGVAGLGNRDETAAWLCELHASFDRVVTLGLSAGAYGALLYGSLANLDRVVAVSPITVKGDDARDDFPTWGHRLEHGPEHPPVHDLKPFFARSRPPVRAFYSDGDGTELDRDMALRLGVPARDVALLPGYSHALLARALAGSDRLREALLS